MSMPSLIVALGALSAGILIDREGDKPMMFLGAGIMILGDLAVMAAPSLGWLLAARALTGIGYVFVSVAAVTALIRLTSGRQRTMALALWSTFVPASFLLPFLTAGLAHALGDWRAAFASHAGLTLIFVLLAIIAVPGKGVGNFSPSRSADIGRVLRAPLPYLLGLSFAGDSFLQTGTLATLGPYLHNRYGVEEFLVQKWGSLAMVFNALACLGVGLMLNRGVRSSVLTLIGLVVTAVPAVLIYALPLGYMGSIYASWVLMFGSGILVGMWTLVPFTAPTPDSIGGTSGVVTQITLAGVLIGPPVYFAVQAMTGPLPMVLVVVLSMAVCALRLPICRIADAARAAGRERGTQGVVHLAE